MNSREAAFLAVWEYLKEGRFAAYYLAEWQKKEHPDSRDFHLSQEIAYGTIRRLLSLDFLGKNLAKQNKLPGKLKEKILLRMALYQFYFMDKVPLYAIVDETVKIARKYCHETFVRGLNAMLRQLDKIPLTLPQGETVEAISTRLSYPPFFVQRLINDYGLQKALEILELGNRSPLVMARKRGPDQAMLTLESDSVLSISKDPSYYIQNATPAALIEKLTGQQWVPKKILDLCASPGGKLVSLHDHFPDAQLYANDVNEDKLDKIKENLTKYHIEAVLNCGKGEHFPEDEQFDLIVLDVPCSNTGVLNKRPEARWRLSQESLQDLEKSQLSLLQKARALMHLDSQIWYMTCSLLKSENEDLLRKACSGLGLKILSTQTLFPNEEGWDGGFAAILVQALPLSH